MKAYIEFFEKEASENICSSLIAPPDTVILIGDRKKLMEEHAERYKEVLQKKNKKIEFICKTVNKHNIDDIISLLSDIVKEYDDCVFDLTGGEDLFLVAMGIVCERYKKHLYTNFECMYRQGYVKRESTIIGDKKKRVYYSLNSKGKERLEILLREYNRVVKGVNLIIEKNK